MSVVASGLSLLYRPDRAHVWVEDRVTQGYLEELFQDSTIVFHAGGGNQTIRAVAHNAELHGLPNVVGIVDCDYGTTNFAQWTNPASGARVFSLPVHEIENYLLDPAALAGCALNNFGRSAADIETHIRNVALQFEWQVSASQVIAEWRDIFQSDFPRHPSRAQAADSPTSLGYLQGLPWYTSVVARTNTITAAGEPAAMLTTKHTSTANWLAGAEWKERFPGKELFRDIRGYVYDPAALGVSATGIEPDIDVAKAVAAWQRSHGIPAVLTTLQAVIHAKTGV